MTPSELNAVARLVFIAKRCGADFLDNADSFDNMIGAGRFAETDRKVLDMVRRVVKPLPDCRLDNWVCPSEMKRTLDKIVCTANVSAARESSCCTVLMSSTNNSFGSSWIASVTLYG